LVAEGNQFRTHEHLGDLVAVGQRVTAIAVRPTGAAAGHPVAEFVLCKLTICQKLFNLDAQVTEVDSHDKAQSGVVERAGLFRWRADG
jgi:hypothetical protein